MIKFQNVNKYYGDFQALKNINLEIGKGEVVTLIGPSGSGKSTLTRCINGLEAISDGALFVNDINIADPKVDMRQVRQNIGMVFQHFELYPHKTVLENITLAPMKVLGMNEAEAIEDAERRLNNVSMLEHKDKYPSQISGGQKQRVAIARALAMRPSVMLFDEPTSALDPETIGDVLAVIERLGTNQPDLTMVIVTHEMGFAREASDRTIFMAKGEIIEDRPSEEFFLNPQDPRAIQFLDQVIDR
ncbi:amino acid ABC transporter ATP-binding protein [Suicoccus acidiformans]|uniref:Amino acid ABC transporter ATP-binding protein n=2 Tax=Suicoccus acidiformans TaxID=2036206 RepID=A0A347WJH4_9LACT|nr:amino acid ABC transporter ATP-binding protein [Suicoccus acidiformans]